MTTDTPGAEMLTNRLRFDSNDCLSDLVSAAKTLSRLPEIVKRLREINESEAQVRAEELLSALSSVATAVENATQQVLDPSAEQEQPEPPQQLGYVFVVG